MPVIRASVKETFDRITTDAKEALALLTIDYQAENLYGVSRANASALLARVYLILQDYEQALDYANISLSYYDPLLDFNELAPDYQFSNEIRPEVIFYSQETGTAGIFNNTAVSVNPSLIALYDNNDLRLRTFLNGMKVLLINMDALLYNNGALLINKEGPPFYRASSDT